MHLLVCISHHGRGHLAQIAPVLNALRVLWPALRLTVRSALPYPVLAERIRGPFVHYAQAADCGLSMRDALRVDLDASLTAYRDFHAQWPKRVYREAEFLRAAGIDAVLSNVAYLPLAAARVAGIPAVALCSLNWLDIFRHYFGEAAGAPVIMEQMAAAYGAARAFLRPTPSMPMADLPHGRAVPPIAQRGIARRQALRLRLGLSAAARIVLVGMGGIAYRPKGEDWQRGRDLAWLVPDDWRGASGQVYGLSEAGMPFRDLLASCDALVTKPGYGSFVEAAVSAVPVLYLPRPDWPETPYLVDWLQRNARAAEIDEHAWQSAGIEAALERLWAMPPAQPVEPAGAQVAASALRDLLA